MRRVKTIRAKHTVVRDGVNVHEVCLATADAPEQVKYLTFWATDEELEKIADRLLELAGVEVLDE